MAYHKFSFYRKYHKFIRRRLFELSIQMAKSTVALPASFGSFMEQLEDMCNLLMHHAHIEDEMIHPLIKDWDEDLYVSLVAEHDDIEKKFLNIKVGIKSLDEDDMDKWHEHYLQLNTFIAEYLIHLNYEETVLMPLFQEKLPEDRLMSNKRKLRTEREVDEFLGDIRVGLGDCNFLEQVEFLAEIRAHEDRRVVEKVEKVMAEVLENGEEVLHFF